MENINKFGAFKQSTKNTEFGILTTLTTDTGLSAKDSISFGQQTLLANYVYDQEGNYKLVYTIVDENGNAQSYAENDGILPTLFLSPTQENYVSVVPYHPDKELEICIPVFQRENIKSPKGNRPFTASFIGTSNQFSIFHDADMWSDTKPDKMIAMEFKDGALKKKHNIKLALPRNNKIYISDNKIHLLSSEGETWTHRQIDEKGQEIRSRTIKSPGVFYKQILSLSFEHPSYLIGEEEGNIVIIKIDTDGNSTADELIDIASPYYNTWQPVQIAEQTTVTRFNGEFGNGWFTIKENKLIEIFYSKGERGYKNLLTGSVLEMGKDNLVLTALNKTKHNGYAVVFYPMTELPNKPTELLVLNRELKD